MNGATLRTFPHDDPGSLRRLRAPHAAPSVVCMDGINNMSGNAPAIPAFARVARDYDSLLYIDDSHGSGVAGSGDPTSCAATEPPATASFATSARLREHHSRRRLLQGVFVHARLHRVPDRAEAGAEDSGEPYLSSGQSPVASLATVIEGLELNEERGDQLRLAVYRMTSRVLSALREFDIATPNVSGYPIIEIPLANAEEIEAVGAYLFHHGIYVTMAVPPLCRTATRASGCRSARSTHGSRSSSSCASSATSRTGSASRARSPHDRGRLQPPVGTGELVRALLWSLAPMPALVVAYVLAPPYVVIGVALASGNFVVLIVLRTARLLHEQELENRRFTSLVRHSSDLVTVIDSDTTIRFISPSVERMLGFAPDELEGTSFAELIHPDQAALALEFILGERAEHPIEITLRRSDGAWLDSETLRTNLLHDESVRGIVLNTRDITERKAFLNQLERHAFYDSLTGLANRALFRDRVNHALSQAMRSANDVAALFMDVDDFKVVNDTHGHAVGDALLTAIGGRLRSCLRSGDTVSRLGGDEFAILLEESTDVAPIEVAGRIMRTLEAPFRIDGHELHVRASIGIAYANGQEGDTATEELLRNADVAMYVAKNHGKGRCEVYQPTTHKTVMSQVQLQDRTTACPRPRRVRAALPAARHSRDGAHLGPRGARTLAAPRAGDDSSARLHPARRGERTDHPTRALGAADGLP